VQRSQRELAEFYAEDPDPEYQLALQENEVALETKNKRLAQWNEQRRILLGLPPEADTAQAAVQLPTVVPAAPTSTTAAAAITVSLRSPSVTAGSEDAGTPAASLSTDPVVVSDGDGGMYL